MIRGRKLQQVLALVAGLVTVMATSGAGAWAQCPGGGNDCGACCVDPSYYSYDPDLCLDNIEPFECENYFFGGVYQGNGTTCADTVCPGTGACCVPGGGCEDNVNAAVCADFYGGGAYQGDGSTCDNSDCGVGACCLDPGYYSYDPDLCVDGVQDFECVTYFAGGTYQGNGTACGDVTVQCQKCPGDTNDDGEVGVLDLVNVIVDWNTDGSANGGDVTGDGIVNVTDLVTVITQWGRCP